MTNISVDSFFAQTDYQHLKLQQTSSETLRMCHIFLFPYLKGRREGREPQRFSVIATRNFWEYSGNYKVLLKAFCFNKNKLLSIPVSNMAHVNSEHRRKGCSSCLAAIIQKAGYKRHSINSMIFSGV